MAANDRVLATLLLAAAASACVATTDDIEMVRVPSYRMDADVDSPLGRSFDATDEGASLFAPVDGGAEGLDLRLALTATARSSIDVQSYLWHEDSCGSLLLERLLEAADRGVRVRLLIDGFRLEGHEELDEALALHPNVEIRAFNPTLHRAGLWKEVELLEHVSRFDHRMHNKLFLADGVVGLFGGRNVGDEYFGLGDVADFRDFELLAAGDVVEELADSFDEFWNGEWSVPLEDLVAAPAGGEEQEALASARATLAGLHVGDGRLDARRALSPDAWTAALERARDHMLPGRAQVVHDLARITREGATGVLGQAFEEALARSDGDAIIVTAYLVPDAELLERIERHVEDGWRVRILTNSYVTNNQPLAHTFYAETRRKLIEAGVELYELRGDAWGHVHHRSPGSRAPKIALHAKTAVLGEEHLIVGSMNLDPRSMKLNTELGVLIESRPLAQVVRRLLEGGTAPRNAWRVELDEEGRLRWVSQGVVLTEEPAPSRGARLYEWFLSLLPLADEV